MKRDCNILIALILIVSIGTGGVFLAFPKKAEAGIAECLAGILSGKAKGKVEVAKASFSGLGMNVPVKDAAAKAMIKADANINTNTSSQAQGSTVTRCIVEPMVAIMARSLLNTFTAQTINWINSGFKGSPLYVTNPQGFLTDIADQSIGQFIEGLGPIGKILCSPFDFQLRMSLNLQFGAGGGGYYQEIGCRLTDIQQNVQRAFTGGVFGANGWDNWLQLTNQPQNNPYGAFIKASESLSFTIAGHQIINLKMLDWGKGFLSSTDPVTGEISTPGTVIEGQLNAVLPQPVQNVGLAKDIDAILGALINQLINQVLGPGGLLGASKSGGGRRPAAGITPTPNGATPGGGISPTARALAMTPEAIIAANEATQKLPDGLFVETSATAKLGPTATDEESGAPTGPTPELFCTAFKQNIYSADKAETGNVLTNATPIVVKVGGEGDNIATKKNGNVKWTLADYNRVATFCQNVNVTAPIGEAARGFTDQTGLKVSDVVVDDTQPSSNLPANLAINKDATQSSTCNGGTGHSDNVNQDTYAKNAVDGNTQSSFYYGIAATCDTASKDDWWQVDLGAEKSINKIRIYKASTRGSQGTEERTGFDMQYPFSVIATKTDLGADKDLEKIVLNNDVVLKKDFATLNTSPLEIVVNKNARYVRIQSDKLVSLAEVEVIGTAVDSTVGGGNSGPEIEVSPATQESKPQDTTNPNLSSYDLAHRDFASTFKITVTKNQTGLKARVKLLAVMANNGPDQTPQFSSVFAPNSFKIGDTTIDVQKNSSVFNSDLSLAPNQTLYFTELARIADHPIFNTASSYLSYKLVLEIYKVVNDQETIMATQTTTFKIQ